MEFYSSAIRKRYWPKGLICCCVFFFTLEVYFSLLQKQLFYPTLHLRMTLITRLLHRKAQTRLSCSAAFVVQYDTMWGILGASRNAFADLQCSGDVLHTSRRWDTHFFERSATLGYAVLQMYQQIDMQILRCICAELHFCVHVCKCPDALCSRDSQLNSHRRANSALHAGEPSRNEAQDIIRIC